MIALYRDNKTPTTQHTYHYEPISLWEWAKEHRSPDYIPPQMRDEKGDFVGIINPGVAVLFYRNAPEELKIMPKEQLSKRLYIVTELKKDLRICLRWHREARAKKYLQESYNIEWETGVPLLCLSQSTYQNHTLFAGIDFDISINGEIIFKE